LILVGFSWTREHRSILESAQFPIDLNDCQLLLEFAFDTEGKECFPRKKTGANSFGDFAMLTIPNDTFQIEEISMEFDTVDFNWFASPHTEKNSQFADALENRVANIYKESWISKYYQWDVKSDNGIITFWDKANNTPRESKRFTVFVFIPETTRPYFFPKSEYKYFTSITNIKLDIISNIPNGFKSKCFPASKSLFYTAPFFFKLKTPLPLQANYLVFKDTFSTNHEDTILAMVNYNPETDTFVADFAPQILLLVSNSFYLNKYLEFILVDSNNEQLLVEDNSQLFFTLSINK